ncbi:uncharacterized protein LOC110841929 [Folsomia candida]|uniref:Uncharacterized protein n=1 Tax=Folsomia candida TaxID=158441 RepID=A0A226F3Q6_FOLCA|nr:uncharacterized protein LOC110841929 [Folsomia candida]OXA64108.1 hypothetical protein Fcan01_01484 [Folsomia candida]
MSPIADNSSNGSTTSWSFHQFFSSFPTPSFPNLRFAAMLVTIVSIAFYCVVCVLSVHFLVTGLKGDDKSHEAFWTIHLLLAISSDVISIFLFFGIYAGNSKVIHNCWKALTGIILAAILLFVGICIERNGKIVLTLVEVVTSGLLLLGLRVVYLHDVDLKRNEDSLVI